MNEQEPPIQCNNGFWDLEPEERAARMETIRVTEDERRRIADAAAGNGCSKQQFCLASIMDRVKQWEATPEPEPAVPAGMIRVRPFEGQWFEITQMSPPMPTGATEVLQYQAGGDWYFQTSAGGQVLGMWKNDTMQAFL